MKRRYTRTSTRRTINIPSLATAGERDRQYFPLADTVTMTLGREDLDTIAAALVFVGKPETLSLLRRFRCR